MILKLVEMFLTWMAYPRWMVVKNWEFWLGNFCWRFETTIFCFSCLVNDTWNNLTPNVDLFLAMHDYQTLFLHFPHQLPMHSPGKAGCRGVYILQKNPEAMHLDWTERVGTDLRKHQTKNWGWIFVQLANYGFIQKCDIFFCDTYLFEPIKLL